MTTPIRLRDRSAIINALRAGVVPARGVRHLQVGRELEVDAMIEDLRQVKDGGAAFRIISGPWGSGKTFFLHVMRDAAHRAGFVTMSADLTAESRLYGTKGKTQSTFSALVASAGTKSQPEGGAMAEVLERFVSKASEMAHRSHRAPQDVIDERLAGLRQYRGGYEFRDVVMAYWTAVRDGDEDRRAGVLRWLRAEYGTKTEAKQAIGVNGIIDDADLLPSLQLLAALTKSAGYSGLVVELDEVGILRNLDARSRQGNYEQILTMVNSLLSGEAHHLGIILAGIPEFVTDPVRGLYSYQPLRQRLSGNVFLQEGLRDAASPVITLEPLPVEHLPVLLEKVHRVYRSNATRDPVTDIGGVVDAFLAHAAGQLGGLAMVTPREATRSWLQFLDVLNQNRHADWRRILDGVPVLPDTDLGPLPGDAGLPGRHQAEPDSLVGFRL